MHSSRKSNYRVLFFPKNECPKSKSRNNEPITCCPEIIFENIFSQSAHFFLTLYKGVRLEN